MTFTVGLGLIFHSPLPKIIQESGPCNKMQRMYSNCYESEKRGVWGAVWYSLGMFDKLPINFNFFLIKLFLNK